MNGLGEILIICTLLEAAVIIAMWDHFQTKLKSFEGWEQIAKECEASFNSLLDRVTDMERNNRACVADREILRGLLRSSDPDKTIFPAADSSSAENQS